jgi:NAD(P)-dependent dehydrogenase (short-subunit alcohol dehydrogenase family)
MNFTGKTVLITGGTRGIGLETGLAFGKLGAQCVLTYNWGDHDDAQILEAFRAAGAPTPILAQADVGKQEDTMQLLTALKPRVSQIDIFISNVSASMIIKSFEDYTLKGLKQSIAYSSWPMVSYTLAIREVFGKYPAYVTGVSSTGPDHYSYGYDFVAASKTVMEVLCRYLNYRLRGEGVVINAVRSRAIKTKSLENTFGKDLETFVRHFLPDNYWIQPEEVANAIVALCSGYCDAISGQTINVDRGTAFFDNFMDLYTRFKKNPSMLNHLV